MSEPNGNGGNRILTLDQANRNAKDAHGRHLRHNATVEDVYQIVAAETSKVIEHYLSQVPPHVARMIQDALMAYGLIKLTDEALAAVPESALTEHGLVAQNEAPPTLPTNDLSAASNEPVVSENAAGDTPEADRTEPVWECWACKDVFPSEATLVEHVASLTACRSQLGPMETTAP